MSSYALPATVTMQQASAALRGVEAALAAGGDWLLQIPLHRSLGRSMAAIADAL